LQLVAVPGFDHARRASRNVGLAEAVRVIRGPEDFGQPSALIKMRGEWKKLG
jgi:hypothetical protein